MELAKVCVSTCEMFGPATNGGDMEPIRNKQVKDLARCVVSSELSSPMITGGIRRILHIERTLGKQKYCARDLQEPCPLFNKEWTVAWRELLCAVQCIFDVGHFRSHQACPRFLNYLRET